jgi:hypothetical protein
VIVLGNLPVSRTDLEAKKNAIIDAKSPWDAVEAFKPVIAAAKAHGSLVIGQTTHGGRQVSEDVNKNPVSSSDVQSPPLGGMTFAKPRPLTVPEIDDLVKAWGHAADVLYKAGADGVQLHSAHGKPLLPSHFARALFLTLFVSLSQATSSLSSFLGVSTDARTTTVVRSRTATVSSSESSKRSAVGCRTRSLCSRSSQ